MDLITTLINIFIHLDKYLTQIAQNYGVFCFSQKEDTHLKIL
jgi:hypothetical protein